MPYTPEEYRAYYLANREELRAKQAAYYQANREKLAEKSNERYRALPQEERRARDSACRARHPERQLLRAAKKRADARGLLFLITVEDVVIPDKCPALGTPLVRNVGGRTGAPNSPSLDRIIPELGYIPGNVQVISHKANMMKQNATKDELRAFARWVLSED